MPESVRRGPRGLTRWFTPQNAARRRVAATRDGRPRSSGARCQSPSRRDVPSRRRPDVRPYRVSEKPTSICLSVDTARYVVRCATARRSGLVAPGNPNVSRPCRSVGASGYREHLVIVRLLLRGRRVRARRSTLRVAVPKRCCSVILP